MDKYRFSVEWKSVLNKCIYLLQEVSFKQQHVGLMHSNKLYAIAGASCATSRVP